MSSCDESETEDFEDGIRRPATIDISRTLPTCSTHPRPPPLAHSSCNAASACLSVCLFPDGRRSSSQRRTLVSHWCWGRRLARTMARPMFWLANSHAIVIINIGFGIRLPRCKRRQCVPTVADPLSLWASEPLHALREMSHVCGEPSASGNTGGRSAQLQGQGQGQGVTRSRQIRDDGR